MPGLLALRDYHGDMRTLLLQVGSVEQEEVSVETGVQEQGIARTQHRTVQPESVPAVGQVEILAMAPHAVVVCLEQAIIAAVVVLPRQPV